MTIIALGLGAAGFVSAFVGWVTYLATIPRGKVPVRPVGGVLLAAGGVVLPAAGIAWSIRQAGAPSWLLLVLSALGIMFGALFLFVLSQRKTPIGDIKVSTGDSLLPFSATDSEGNPFHSDSLAGKRILLKFFRGGW